MPDVLLKNCLANKALKRIASSIKKAHKPFPVDDFVKKTNKLLKPLELKERVDCIIAQLHDKLPDDFEKTAKILLKTKKHWDYGTKNEKYPEFAAWPLVDYVGKYGLDTPETSLSCLMELTELFSAEFAIRPYINSHYKLTFKHLDGWVNHKNEHVRRLVSEGIRPRLPWGTQLPQFIKNPKPVLKLLNQLKNDPSLYVRRSVANNLNDISKDNPDEVVELCLKWNKNCNEEIQWMLRHALRTLIKQGYPDVFPLLGYTKNPKIEIGVFKLENKNIQLGESLKLTFDIKSQSKQSQSFVLDYAIHHVKANGKLTKKIFKLSTVSLGADKLKKMKKHHVFKKITTRKYYSGEHKISIMVNGKIMLTKKFQLSV